MCNATSCGAGTLAGDATAGPAGTGLRLDLGCGQHTRDGFEGVDFFAPEAKHRVDLMRFPWPWPDSSVDELFSTHFLEHLPMVFVGPDGDVSLCPQTVDHRDLLLRFMDECWRILKPGARFTVIVPCGRSNRAFQDPTHRRFFVGETFAYFNAAWRAKQGLGHYLGACDFDVTVEHRVKQSFTALDPAVQQEAMARYWNCIEDFMATLTARK